MSLLQFVVIIAAVVFVLFGIDLYKRKKANILHFLVFLGGGTALVLFAIDNRLLNAFGEYFGVARGADLIVYISIIILFYLFIDGYNKQTRDETNLSKLVSQLAIQQAYDLYSMNIQNQVAKDKKDTDNFLFLIRSYNEAQTIGSVIDDVIKAGYRKMLIINDGSTDSTNNIIAQKQQENPDILIIVVEHSINRGGGCANKTGFGFVSQYHAQLAIDRVVTVDADGQMDIKDMKYFTQAMKITPAGMYLGSRFIHGAKTYNMPLLRKVILFVSKIVTRVLYGTKITDPHNGFRIISVDTLKKIHITADGMHYANEINEQIVSHKLSYVEVPVHIRYTQYSLAKGQKNSNSIKLAVEMIYKKIFFR